MNKTDFLTNFLLRPLCTPLLKQQCSIQASIQALNKEAAVLITIFNKKESLITDKATIDNTQHKSSHSLNNLHVLLTQRSLHLRHHPGQICFPGGKVEASDNSKSDTARREALEEINIDCKPCDVIATLPNHQTLTGFNICPIVAFIEQPKNLKIDENEVSEIFTIPLSFILNIENYITVNTVRHKQPHTIHYLTYQHHKIWGATAAMLYDIAIHFNKQVP